MNMDTNKFTNKMHAGGTLARKGGVPKQLRIALASHIYEFMIHSGCTQAQAGFVYQSYLNDDEMYLNTETGGVVGDKT
jgi:hypothetical protein